VRGKKQSKGVIIMAETIDKTNLEKPFLAEWFWLSSFFMLGSIGAVISMKEWNILIFILGPYCLSAVFIFGFRFLERVLKNEK
jgi:hypothetical protein